MEYPVKSVAHTFRDEYTQPVGQNGNFDAHSNGSVEYTSYMSALDNISASTKRLSRKKQVSGRYSHRGYELVSHSGHSIGVPRLLAICRCSKKRIDFPRKYPSISVSTQASFRVHEPRYYRVSNVITYQGCCYQEVLNYKLLSNSAAHQS